MNQEDSPADAPVHAVVIETDDLNVVLNALRGERFLFAGRVNLGGVMFQCWVDIVGRGLFCITRFREWDAVRVPSNRDTCGVWDANITAMLRESSR